MTRLVLFWVVTILTAGAVGCGRDTRPHQPPPDADTQKRIREIMDKEDQNIPGGLYDRPPPDTKDDKDTKKKPAATKPATGPGAKP